MPDSVQLSTIEELRGQFDRGCLVACRYRPLPELPTVPRLVRGITSDGLILLFGSDSRVVAVDAPWVERWEAYEPGAVRSPSVHDAMAGVCV